jgi:hypothetical protein
LPATGQFVAFAPIRTAIWLVADLVGWTRRWRGCRPKPEASGRSVLFALQPAGIGQNIRMDDFSELIYRAELRFI